MTADGLEDLRKACGGILILKLISKLGHGFLLSSGLPTLFTDYVAACTYEGIITKFE